jgi:CBS domain-containing protein
MVADPVTADAQETIGAFIEHVPRATRFAVYPVIDAGRAVGLLPFGRVLHLPHDEWGRRLVAGSTVPLEEVAVLDPDESAIDALAALSADGLHRGLVVRDGHLVGLLSLSDFSRVLQIPARR